MSVAKLMGTDKPSFAVNRSNFDPSGVPDTFDRAKQEKEGEFTIGRPDLANPATDPTARLNDNRR